MALVWLSFVDDAAEPRVSLGCCVVDVEPPDVVRAARAACALGINPGGQVAAWAIPIEADAQYRPHRDRLMTRADAVKLGLA